MTDALAYYNEIDSSAAAWLRELIKGGHIAAGEVDERRIEDVRPADLRGYTQCHFFAGIGGWSFALRLAGWPDSRPVWTGSCPCQPFSQAGKGRGEADERHLWPAFFHLIEQCRPAIAFGEQVASADGLKWLDLVSADLERAGYAVGAADLCAAGVGAPHIRQRLYWVADADAGGKGVVRVGSNGGRGGSPGRVGDAELHGHDSPIGGSLARREVARVESGLQQRQGPDSSAGPEATRPLHGHWRAADWLACRDGRWRPVDPGTFPLAHGLPARVGRLRGYGNAIVPQVAAAFVRAAA